MVVPIEVGDIDGQSRGVTGKCANDRVFGDGFSMVLKIVVHVDLQKGKQGKASGLIDVPPLRCHALIELIEERFGRFTRFQGRHRNAEIVLHLVSKSRIDDDFIIMKLENEWRCDRFPLQRNRDQNERRLNVLFGRGGFGPSKQPKRKIKRVDALFADERLGFVPQGTKGLLLLGRGFVGFDVALYDFE